MFKRDQTAQSLPVPLSESTLGPAELLFGVALTGMIVVTVALTTGFRADQGPSNYRWVAQSASHGMGDVRRATAKLPVANTRRWPGV